MAIVKALIWWYAEGWRVFIGKVGEFFANTADFFSMSSLVRTLFKPFRQISAETGAGEMSLEMRLHAFVDRLVSRVVGFCSRLVLLVIGGVVMVVTGVGSLVMVILWPVVPLAPVAGVVLTVMGVGV